MRRIIAIDPGLKTGMCIFELAKDQEPTLIWSGEIDEDGYADVIRWQLTHYPDTEVVCEIFKITMETAKKTQSAWSLELIGVLKQTMRDFKRPVEDIHFQKPADAMNMFPNTALHKLEYWHRGGAGHALDSIRHALLYMAKTGWKPIRLLRD